MNLRNARVLGNFQSIPDPRTPDDKSHRVTRNRVAICWEWRPSRNDAWRQERFDIPAGERWDGASRPDFVGWLVPRWGVMSAASLAHDWCFTARPALSDGEPISRKHADLLYLHLMRTLADQRVTSGWKEPAQLALAEVMYRAVRVFGEPVWDAHDSEFSKL